MGNRKNVHVLCPPDIRVFGDQSGDFQEEQSGVSQLEDFSDGSDGATEPVCVLTLQIESLFNASCREPSSATVSVWTAW